MRTTAENVQTGEKVTINISDEHYRELESLTKDKVSDSKLQTYIDNLDISADAKALIASILKTAVKVGELVVRVGKRIVEVAVMIATKFPNAAFGLILGLLAGALVAAIPIIGTFFAAILAPIAALFGLVKGYVDDVRDQELTRKIAEATAMFQPLNGEIHVAG